MQRQGSVKTQAQAPAPRKNKEVGTDQNILPKNCRPSPCGQNIEVAIGGEKKKKNTQGEKNQRT